MFHAVILNFRNVESSVSIATRYGLEGSEFEPLSQWPSGLRRESEADSLLGLRFRIPPGAWTFVLWVLYSKEQKAKAGTVRTKK